MKHQFLSIILPFICKLCALLASAQESNEQKPKVKMELEGMIAATAGNNIWSVNVGGPTLKLKFSKSISFGVGAFPSFYVKNGNSGAKLGVGPRFDYKSYVLLMSFFHILKAYEWKTTIGLANKFQQLHSQI